MYLFRCLRRERAKHSVMPEVTQRPSNPAAEAVFMPRKAEPGHAGALGGYFLRNPRLQGAGRQALYIVGVAGFNVALGASQGSLIDNSGSRHTLYSTLCPIGYAPSALRRYLLGTKDTSICYAVTYLGRLGQQQSNSVQ